MASSKRGRSCRGGDGGTADSEEVVRFTVRLPASSLPFNKTPRPAGQKRGEKAKRAVMGVADKRTVVIIGAGTAGLSAARSLEELSPSLDVIVLEGRDRIGGRIQTATLKDGTRVDRGASYIHGCNREDNYVLNMAMELNVRLAREHGGYTAGWLNNCLWYDEDGNPIVQYDVNKAWEFFQAVSEALSEKANMLHQESRDASVGDVLRKHLPKRLRKQLSRMPRIQQDVFHRLVSTVWGYSGPVQELSARLMAQEFLPEGSPQDSLSYQEEDADTAGATGTTVAPVAVSAGKMRYDEGSTLSNNSPDSLWGEELGFVAPPPLQPPPFMASSSLRGLGLMAPPPPPPPLLLPAHPHPSSLPSLSSSGDRAASSSFENDFEEEDALVVGGYDFLIQRLSLGVNIKLNKVVRTIVSTKTGAVVYTSDGDSYECDAVIVTVPLGVLQGKAESTAIRFVPPLSDRKQEAIRSLSMGTESKVILQFKEPFWKLGGTPYIQTTVPGLRMLSLHDYGKPGVLVAHLCPPFSVEMQQQSDKTVLNRVLQVLGSIYGEEYTRMEDLVEWDVTRWSQDPFCNGSYSFMPVDASFDHVHTLKEREARLLFAGEHTSAFDGQCVTGAYDTGHDAALEAVEQVLEMTRCDFCHCWYSSVDKEGEDGDRDEEEENFCPKCIDEDVDNKKFCLCRQPDDGREYVQCWDCDGWFHLACLGLHDAPVDYFSCPSCCKKAPSKKQK